MITIFVMLVFLGSSYTYELHNRQNQIASSCTRCPPYCDPTENPLRHSFCSFECNCPKYYVRVSKTNSTCIPQVSCKTNCDENEVYRECGTLCPGTCSEPLKACVKICAKGCYCKDNYILEDSTRKCIKTENCPTS